MVVPCLPQARNEAVERLGVHRHSPDGLAVPLVDQGRVPIGQNSKGRATDTQDRVDGHWTTCWALSRHFSIALNSSGWASDGVTSVTM